jgi:hypothetical protein
LRQKNADTYLLLILDVYFKIKKKRNNAASFLIFIKHFSAPLVPVLSQVAQFVIAQAAHV